MNFVKIDEKMYISVKSDKKNTLIIRDSASNKGNKIKVNLENKHSYLNQFLSDLLNLNVLTKKEFSHLLYEIEQPIHNNVIGINFLKHILENKSNIKSEILNHLTEEQLHYLEKEKIEPNVA